MRVCMVNDCAHVGEDLANCINSMNGDIEVTLIRGSRRFFGKTFGALWNIAKLRNWVNFPIFCLSFLDTSFFSASLKLGSFSMAPLFVCNCKPQLQPKLNKDSITLRFQKTVEPCPFQL